ncbi:MAG TPA: DUF4203 domain-containing protein [Terriglobia bacterium]|nr:DUF4203 domain-containing protein [Terriglobia bacterium]
MINLSVPTVGLLVGAAILLLGRKLFWLFVAAIGFALGAEIAPQIIHQPAPVVTLVIALVLGLLGALFAVLLQKFAVAASGFVTGGWLAIRIYAFLTGHAGNVEIVFLVGGILGAILFLALFDWALILFSSLVGARFIAMAIALTQTGRMIFFILLVVVGIAVQSSMLSPARRSGRR